MLNILIIRGIKSFFSVEFIFSLFLLAGWFKSFVQFPIDLTLFFLALSVFLVLRKSYLEGFVLPKYGRFALTAYIGIVIVAIASMLYTPSIYYAPDKLFRMIVITTWCFVGPFFIFNSERSVKRFFLGYVVLAIFLATSSIQEFIFNASGSSGFVETSTGLNYIHVNNRRNFRQH